MRRCLSISFFVLFFLFSGGVGAKNRTPPAPAGPPFSEKDLKKLVAPIALYPDPLLAQVLPASIYPLEIVQAARVIHDEKDFKIIESKNWPPSIKAVAHYPSVLKMMDERLEWTEQLGQAVAAQQEEVLRAVQGLRRQAFHSGALQSTPEQKVIQRGDSIEIIPASPELVFVPEYDSQIVYNAPPSGMAGPFMTFGFGYAPGVWLNSCFDWPGYAILYGGPYYWGWGYPGRPFWVQYPWGWDEWGWNHWRPRRSPSGSTPRVHVNPPPPAYPKSGFVPKAPAGIKVIPPSSGPKSPATTPPQKTPTPTSVSTPAPPAVPSSKVPSPQKDSSPPPASTPSKTSPAKTVSSPGVSGPSRTVISTPKNPSSSLQKK